MGCEGMRWDGLRSRSRPRGRWSGRAAWCFWCGGVVVLVRTVVMVSGMSGFKLQTGCKDTRRTRYLGERESDLVEKAAGLGQNAVGGGQYWSEQANTSEEHP